MFQDERGVRAAPVSKLLETVFLTQMKDSRGASYSPSAVYVSRSSPMMIVPNNLNFVSTPRLAQSHFDPKPWMADHKITTVHLYHRVINYKGRLYNSLVQCEPAGLPRRLQPTMILTTRAKPSLNLQMSPVVKSFVITEKSSAPLYT